MATLCRHSRCFLCVPYGVDCSKISFLKNIIDRCIESLSEMARLLVFGCIKHLHEQQALPGRQIIPRVVTEIVCNLGAACVSRAWYSMSTLFSRLPIALQLSVVPFVLTTSFCMNCHLYLRL